MGCSRRRFLIGCSSAVAAMAGSRLTTLSFAKDSAHAGSRDLLVVIFLRGGMDGLNFVAPVNDRDYIAARAASLRLGDTGENAGLPLADGPAGLDFRIHPSAKGLKELYDSKHLAVVHACGLSNGTRSHFEAQDLMERGVVDLKQLNISTGWLTRHLDLTHGDGLLPAIGTSDSTPAALLGCGPAAAIPDINAFSFYGDEHQLRCLRKLYAGESPTQRSGAATLQAIDVVAKHLKRDQNGTAIPYQPENNTKYPENDLSTSLQTVARLAKMDMGLQCAAVDFGGWDTHQGQANYFPTLIEQLSGAIAGFYNDMGRYQNRLSVVVMSEFGRRVKSNESEGTDHGHGNVMLLLGGAVKGGKIYGKWPGLATEQLDDRADLAVTTDYRSVLAEVITGHSGNAPIDSLFPAFTAGPRLGVF
jgi:uncharacterized protein (DUF1501 family)